MLDSYPGSYYQIFNNLILNSLIHGFEDQPGGQTEIFVRAPEASADLQLIIIDYLDNGCGIPEGWHQKLFQPFVTSKRHQDCSGLGMHICFNIVSQLLQGQIQSLPTVGQGAHFRLTLPMVLE